MHSSASRSRPVISNRSEEPPSSSGQRPLLAARQPSRSKAGRNASSEDDGRRRSRCRCANAVFIAMPYSHVVNLAPAGRNLRSRQAERDRKSTRLNSSHGSISYAVFCLKKKKNNNYHLNIITKKHTIQHYKN